MTESAIPPYIDTRKAFLSAEKLRGTINLDRLPRLRECLVSEDAKIEIELEFSINKSKQQLIEGHLSARVEVMCQRCLEPVEIDLRDEIALGLIRKEADIKKLDDNVDPWMIEDFKLDVAVLAEEQLLLCLPIVSMHEDEHCLDRLGYSAKQANNSASEKGAKSNPFAVLKSLKE